MIRVEWSALIMWPQSWFYINRCGGLLNLNEENLFVIFKSVFDKFCCLLVSTSWTEKHYYLIHSDKTQFYTKTSLQKKMISIAIYSDFYEKNISYFVVKKEYWKKLVDKKCLMSTNLRTVNKNLSLNWQLSENFNKKAKKKGQVWYYQCNVSFLYYWLMRLFILIF